MRLRICAKYSHLVYHLVHYRTCLHASLKQRVLQNQRYEDGHRNIVIFPILTFRKISQFILIVRKVTQSILKGSTLVEEYPVRHPTFLILLNHQKLALHIYLLVFQCLLQQMNLPGCGSNYRDIKKCTVVL